MESGDGISSDEIDKKDLEELEQYEKWFDNFRVVGPGMSGNPNDGFQYESL